MLSITPIKNVQNTINKNISFKSGVRSNYGANVINNTSDIKHEGNFITDFLGTVKQSPMFYDVFHKRCKSIENGIKNEQQKLDINI